MKKMSSKKEKTTKKVSSKKVSSKPKKAAKVEEVISEDAKAAEAEAQAKKDIVASTLPPETNVSTSTNIPAEKRDYYFDFKRDEEDKVIGAKLVLLNPVYEKQEDTIDVVVDFVLKKVKGDITRAKFQELIANEGSLVVFLKEGKQIDSYVNQRLAELIDICITKNEAAQPKKLKGVRKGAMVELSSGEQGVIVKYPSNSDIIVQISGNSETRIEITIKEIVKVIS